MQVLEHNKDAHGKNLDVLPGLSKKCECYVKPESWNWHGKECGRPVHASKVRNVVWSTDNVRNGSQEYSTLGLHKHALDVEIGTLGPQEHALDFRNVSQGATDRPGGTKSGCKSTIEGIRNQLDEHDYSGKKLTGNVNDILVSFQNQYQHSADAAITAYCVDTDANMQKVLWSLFYGMRESRIQAAREIQKLTKSAANRRAYLAEAGVIVPLVSMLKSSSTEAKEAALLALLNLAVRNEKNKVRIVHAGAIAPLVELMESGSPSLKESAAAAVLTLSASNANKPVIGASTLTALLVKMLVCGSIQGKVDAVMALYNLSTHRENLIPMLAAGAGDPLVTLLKNCKKSSRVAEKIIALLESLMDFEEGRCSVVHQEGGMLALVEMLEDGTVQGKEHAVGALLTMCQSNRFKYRSAILQEGVIPGLLELTVQGSKDIQQKAQDLLKLLRDPRESGQPGVTSASAILETLVYDIANHVDSAEGDTGTRGAARKMLTEMIQLSMEQVQHMQQRTSMHTPQDVTKVSTK